MFTTAALTYFTVVSLFSYPHHPRSACDLDFSLAASHDDPSWSRDEDTKEIIDPDVSLCVVFCAQGILLAGTVTPTVQRESLAGPHGSACATAASDRWVMRGKLNGKPQQPFRTRHQLKPWKPKQTPTSGVPSIQSPTKLLLNFFLFCLGK